MLKWIQKYPIVVLGILVLGYLLIQTFRPQADERVKWGNDFQVTQADAQKNNRLMLAYFTASWCGPCQQMKRTTFADQAVADEVARWSSVKVDVDEHKDLAIGYNVQSMPSFYVLLPEGKVLTVQSGLMSATEFIAFLKEAEKANPLPSPATQPAEIQLSRRL